MSLFSADILVDLPAFGASAVVLLALVGLGEGLRMTGAVSPEVTRRVVHLGVGVFLAVTPYYFAHPDLIYVLALVFVLVNLLTLRRGWLRGMHGTERPSVGTVTFPLALLPALWIGWTLDPGRIWAFQLSFLILAICDPLAALVGRTLDRPRPYRIGHHTKTLFGSLSFFGTAFIICLIAMIWFRAEGQINWQAWEMLAAAGIVALTTAAVEALSGRGWDNFFIVLSALITLVYFDEHPDARVTLIAATGIGLVFAVVTYRFRMLALSGAVAGGLLAVSQMGMIGWAWAVPGFAFFLLSSLISRIGNHHKSEAELLTEKGSVRDAGQVFANGGVAWFLLIVYVIHPTTVLYLGFLGAFAAATADTWATELGTLGMKQPRLITTLRPVPHGTSGAISPLGTLAALAGALTIALAAWPFAGNYLSDLGLPLTLLLITGSGFAASLVDSFMGATVQAHYRDPATGWETERPETGHGRNQLVQGKRWLRNDQVNWVCTFSGAAFAMACFLAVIFAS